MSSNAGAMRKINIDVAKERQKPRLEGLLFSDYGAVIEDGKTIIAGIINQINVDPAAKETGQFFLFIRVAGLSEGKFEIIIFDPKGKNVIGGLVEGDISTDKSGQGAIQIIEPLALAPVQEGTYWVSIFYKGEMLGGAALLIKYNVLEVKDGSNSNLETRRKPRKINKKKSRKASKV